MKVSPGNLRAWEKLGQKGSIFNYGLLDLVKENPNVKVLSADLSLLSGLDRFIRKYPDKFIQTGIAEQNMMAIAAGYAMEGHMSIATTYSSFIAVRSLEQIRQNVSNTNANVKVIGTFAGVVAAKSGVSHWATEDLAFMRALPNLTVLSPADSLEALKCFETATKLDTPVYLRLSGGINCPSVYTEDYDYKLGKFVKLKEGDDVAIIATGLMVNEALQASLILADKGIKASVYDAHTIKPLDTVALDEIFSSSKLIVTVEEHNIIGGLGSAVAEYKATKANTPRQVFLGFNAFTKAGSQKYICDSVGITKEKISIRIEQEINHGQ